MTQKLYKFIVTSGDGDKSHRISVTGKNFADAYLKVSEWLAASANAGYDVTNADVSTTIFLG